MRWFALLLAALASWACAELAHLGSVLSLLLRLWSTGLIVGDIHSIASHYREAWESLAWCRCAIMCSLGASWLGDESWGRCNAGERVGRHERRWRSLHRDRNVVCASKWVRHGGGLDGVEEVNANCRTLLLESQGTWNVGVNAAIMLGSTDFWLPQQLGAECQLGQSKSSLLHFEGLEIHKHGVVVEICALVLLFRMVGNWRNGAGSLNCLLSQP